MIAETLPWHLSLLEVFKQTSIKRYSGCLLFIFGTLLFYCFRKIESNWRTMKTIETHILWQFRLEERIIISKVLAKYEVISTNSWFYSTFKFWDLLRDTGILPNFSNQPRHTPISQKESNLPETLQLFDQQIIKVVSCGYNTIHRKKIRAISY